MDKKEAEKLKKEQLASLKAASENTQKEEEAIAKLKTKLGKFVEIRTEQEQNCRIVEQQIELLQGEIRKAGGAKLEEMQGVLRGKEQACEELQGRITEQQVNRDSGN